MTWILTSTDTIEVVLGAAVTTNQLQCTACYADEDGTSFVEGANATLTNNTTAVNLVGSPAAGRRRLIKSWSIYNADTIDADVTVRLNLNGTRYIIYLVTLTVGATLLIDGTVIGGGAFSAKYPPSATDPGSPPPVAGDTYYNTVLNMIMMWDASRTRWLSIESATFSFGGAGNTAPGSYYAGTDGVIMSPANGFTAMFNGVILSMGYTRTDTDAATFEVVEGGATRASLASTALAGYATNFNGNFTQGGGVLAVRNAAGGNTTSGVLGWVRVKWRI